jgi:hypothetical protein
MGAQVTVKGSGDVGIGTTAPKDKLHIAGVTLSGEGSGATQGSLAFGIDYYGDNVINTWGSEHSSAANIIGYGVKPKSGALGVVSSAGNAAFSKGALRVSNELIFSNASASLVAIGSDVSLTERFRITSAGNVGIGSAAPPYLLTIRGNGASGLATIAIQDSSNSDKEWRIDQSGGDFRITESGVVEALRLQAGGNVGIGITNPSYKLQVSGTVRATSFISDTTTYADFVFDDDYNLPALSEVEAHIAEHGHLPDIPSEAEAMAHGIDLGDMQVKLLQKIEELTLHTIRQEKALSAVLQDNQQLRSELEELKHEIDQ